MLRLNRLLAALGLLVTVVASGIGATADTLTQHWDFSATGATDFPFQYFLFDTSLGALTNVRYELIADTNAVLNVYNFNPNPELFLNAHTSSNVSVMAPPSASVYFNTTLNGSVASGVVEAMVGGVPGQTDYNGLTDHQDISALVSTPFTGYFAPGGGLSPILQSINLHVSDATSSGTAGSGVGFGGSSTTSGTLYLRYDYTSSRTPEPGTLALVFASASVAVAAVRRRRPTTARE
jgi:hypothetical protein